MPVHVRLDLSSFFTSAPGTTFLPQLISYSALMPSILMYSKMGLLFPYSESPSVFLCHLKAFKVLEDMVFLDYYMDWYAVW